MHFVYWIVPGDDSERAILCQRKEGIITYHSSISETQDKELLKVSQLHRSPAWSPRCFAPCFSGQQQEGSTGALTTMNSGVLTKMHGSDYPPHGSALEPRNGHWLVISHQPFFRTNFSLPSGSSPHHRIIISTNTPIVLENTPSLVSSSTAAERSLD